MFSEMTNSSRELESRSRFYRPGKLIAISAILLSASVGMSFAGQYPVLGVSIQSASIDRPCTQLELSADMTLAECGTLTLADVVARKIARDSDGSDE